MFLKVNGIDISNKNTYDGIADKYQDISFLASVNNYFPLAVSGVMILVSVIMFIRFAKYENKKGSYWNLAFHYSFFIFAFKWS